ncbi:13781_t:CDS:2, partial [Dentiscutata heterogama]
KHTLFEFEFGEVDCKDNNITVVQDDEINCYLKLKCWSHNLVKYFED